MSRNAEHGLECRRVKYGVGREPADTAYQGLKMGNPRLASVEDRAPGGRGRRNADPRAKTFEPAISSRGAIPTAATPRSFRPER